MDLKQELINRLGVPENWDKYDYQTQRYSFDDVQEVLEGIVKKLTIPAVGVSLPERNSGGMWSFCEFSDLENDYKEISLASEPTLEKAKELLNLIYHDGYADEMCKDWEFDGKFGKYWDGVRYEEMYFRFDKPKYVA